MSYTVLARRYRAVRFAEVIGQEPIARTLQNAIATGRVAHAFLFTGTRGVGKTSMARIFARALNAPDTIDDCPPPPDQDRYPDAEMQQRMAAAIMRGDDLNVIEIDGASNNSVEQARQLIANVSLSPTDGACYKVYIIDEVHMLSPAAFNALLKTMEEPPGHVKFVLCTTEPEKVPATIQSRCQRFDFRTIPITRIAGHLRHVLDAEQVAADDDLVWHLARLGNGSMRDALSLLDRLLATGTAPLTLKVLEDMFGLPPQDLVEALVGAIAAGDVAAALGQTAALIDHGIGQDQLTDVLIQHLRQLMLISACGRDSELVALPDAARSAAAAQAARFDTAGLVHMIALCDGLHRATRDSASPRALLEATIVRLALAEKMADVTAILAGGAGVEATAAPPKKKVAAAPLNADVAAEALSAAGRPRQATAVPPTAAPSETGPPAGVPPTAARPPAAPAGREPPAAGTPPDDTDLWQRVLDSANKPSLSWVSRFQLCRLEGRIAHVAPLPGHRDLLSFATQQRQRLADLLRACTGHPVEVRFVTDAAATPPRPDPGSEAASSSRPDPAARPGGNGTSPPAGQPGGGAVDQQTVMSLPLVRQVLERFDATLISAWRLDEPDPPE